MTSTEQALTEMFDSLNEWINKPNLDGSVDAWRERLGIESKEHFRTYNRLCWLAHRDRPAAVNAAKELSTWFLYDGQYDSKPLLRTIDVLVRFPEPGQLEEHLASLSVPLGDVHDEFIYEYAVLPEQFIESRGHAYRFDAENGCFPARHDQLMSKLIAKSGLNETMYSEKAPSDYHNREEKYQLKAIVNGKSYEVEAGHFGGWYDYLTVIKILNQILSDQGLEEKLFLLDTRDQTVSAWLAKPETVRTLLSQDLIELSLEQELS